jgi:hypothetical protein
VDKRQTKYEGEISCPVLQERREISDESIFAQGRNPREGGIHDRVFSKVYTRWKLELKQGQKTLLNQPLYMVVARK